MSSSAYRSPLGGGGGVSDVRGSTSSSSSLSRLPFPSSLESVPFPTFSAGAIGDERAHSADEWRVSTSVSSSSSTTRRSVIRPASDSPPTSAAPPMTVTQALYNLDPLETPNWQAADELVSASFESDAATLDRVRVLTQQHHQSQSLLRRKEEQVSRLEQQVSDLTRVIEAQARSCDHSDAVQAEHERRERRDLEAIDALRIERDQQADARARAEHACRLEQSAHAQTKSQLKGVVDTQEAKWRAVTLELEAREAAHLHAEQQARVMREELESRLEAVSCAEADAQERVRALELQLRTAREQTAALDTKTKEVTADTEYLARELATLRQQYEIREEAARLADQSAQKQKTLIDQLTKELASVQHELSSSVSRATFDDLQRQHAVVREAHASLESELRSQTSTLCANEIEVQQVRQYAARQEEIVATLQARQTQYAAREIDLADAKSQLATAHFELDAAKGAARAAQASTQEARTAIADLERTCAQLESQVEEQRSSEARLRDGLDARTRSLRTVVEQLRQLADKSPFNKKAAPAATFVEPTSSTSSPTRRPTTNSSSPDAEFGQLREALNAIVLDINARTRQAYATHLETEASLQSIRDEVAEKRASLVAAQREAGERAAEAADRYASLEQHHFQSQQDLLVARSDVQEAQTRESHHRTQLQAARSACALLVRAYRPLATRFGDVVAHKGLLAVDSARFTQVAREVRDLRLAITGFEEASATATPENVSSAPARPAPRVSFRSAVIGVLAARRLWRSAECQYGLLQEVGAEYVPIARDAAEPVVPADNKDARRSRDAPLPHIDDSNPARAAASLVRLLEHFEHASTVSIHSAQLHRPERGARAAQHVNLMQRLTAGQRSFASRRRQVAPSPASAAVSTSLGDVSHIRSAALVLATRVRDLHRQSQHAQAECLTLVAQSTRTEEQLQHEQRRAHDMLRHHAEASRHAEQASAELINALRDQLRAVDNERGKVVSRDEYAELHATSELVLKQCRELERANEQSKAQVALVKAQEKKLRDELEDRDQTIRTLTQVTEEKQKALSAMDRTTSDLPLLQAELRRTQQLQRDREQELSEARHQLQQLQLSYSQLDLDRTDLANAYDETARELSRVQDVVRTIGHAHQLAAEQNAQIGRRPSPSERQMSATPLPSSIATASRTSTTFHTTMRSSSPAAATSFSRISSPSRVTSYAPPAATSSSSGGGVVATTTTPIHLRHHPNGSLSVDFGTVAPTTTTRPTDATSDASGFSAALDHAAAVAPTPLSAARPHPLAHQYTPNVARAFVPSPYVVPSSVASASYAERALFTPSTSQPTRVKFASDTKV